MGLKEKISLNLRGGPKTVKRTISLNLEEELVDRIDRIAKAFSKVNQDKGFSRNSIIEDAVREYAETAEEVLEEEYGVSLDTEIEEDPLDNYNLAIFPARNDGFRRVFLGDKCWYAVRMADYRLPSVQYVACYRAAPISGVTHYAKVDRIEVYPADPKKKIIYFDGDPVELERPVPLGNMSATPMRHARYTTLERLRCAREVKELFQTGD